MHWISQKRIKKNRSWAWTEILLKFVEALTGKGDGPCRKPSGESGVLFNVSRAEDKTVRDEPHQFEQQKEERVCFIRGGVLDHFTKILITQQEAFSRSWCAEQDNFPSAYAEYIRVIGGTYGCGVPEVDRWIQTRSEIPCLFSVSPAKHMKQGHPLSAPYPLTLYELAKASSS